MSAAANFRGCAVDDGGWLSSLPSVGHRFGGPSLATASLATTALPWLDTGSTRRDAFRVVSALRAAGLMTRWPAQLFFAALAVLPGLIAAAWLLAVARLPRSSGLTSLLAGALVAGCAITVRHVAHHRAAPATGLAIMLGLLTAAVGLITMLGWAQPCPEREPHA
jgi:hypothetical protein